jgi:hypothetical protein
MYQTIPFGLRQVNLAVRSIYTVQQGDKGMIAVDAKQLTRVERVIINPDSSSSQMNWARMYRTIPFGSRQVNLAVRSIHTVQHRATGISCTGQ